MTRPETRNSDPKETNPQKQDDGKTNPFKPGNDPDQTPERETNEPPVAKPEKDDKKPGKIGF